MPVRLFVLAAGLGYYRRARYLLEGAQYVVGSLGGEFPTTTKELLKIPGEKGGTSFFLCVRIRVCVCTSVCVEGECVSEVGRVGVAEGKGVMINVGESWSGFIALPQTGPNNCSLLPQLLSGLHMAPW